jgi:hypothetical protein
MRVENFFFLLQLIYSETNIVEPIIHEYSIVTQIALQMK